MTLDRELTLADVITEAMESRLESVYTAMPARVERFDQSRLTVDALPVLHRPAFDNNNVKVVEPLPLVQDVPVMYPRGGGYAVSFPLQKGDFVLLVCSMLNPGEWFDTGNSGDPGDATKHPLSGAIAIPGLFPSTRTDANATADAFVIAGDELRLGASSASQYLARADRVQTQMAFLKAAIDSLAITAGVKPAIDVILALYTGDGSCDKVKAQ